MKTYATSDLYLSAYLKSRGMKITDKEIEGRRTTFIFEDVSNRADLIRDFYNEGPVNITAFVHAIQDIKAIVFNL
jgi:negative regulator of genetic competence, sporulation and motility